MSALRAAWTRWLDSDVWHSFRSSPVAMAAAAVALLCIFCAVFAHWVAPHNPFDLASLADRTEQLPHPRWSRAHRWLASLPEAQRHDAWVACERAGVAWLRDVLGDGYAVHESAHALLLTTQRARQASLTLAFIEDAKQRVSELLEELAQPPDSGKEILLLFHDAEAYYRYISHFYPSEGLPSWQGVLMWRGLTRPPCDLSQPSTNSHTGLTPGAVLASSATGAQPATLYFLSAAMGWPFRRRSLMRLPAFSPGVMV